MMPFNPSTALQMVAPPPRQQQMMLTPFHPMENPGYGPPPPQDESAYISDLLGRCHREAMGTESVASCIDTLCGYVAESYRPLMMTLSSEMRTCARLLRDLAEQCQTHFSRIPVVIDYVVVLLPCLSRTLKDMSACYQDKTLKIDMRWRTMYHKLTEEANMPLPVRFKLYNDFLMLMLQMATRSPNFDMNALDAVKSRILRLREIRGIEPPPPTPVGQLAASELGSLDRPTHWATDIFSRPLPSRTPLTDVELSKAYGPWNNGTMPPDAKILFRRRFDRDRLSIFTFIDPRDDVSYIGVRKMAIGTNTPLVSIHGIHGLCISCEDSCLILDRYSVYDQCTKLWAVLYFKTWEEMVLFHCTFLSLKSESPKTIKVKPKEFELSREVRLFQARIRDDTFNHSVIVYEDIETKRLRLHAAVWGGEMRQSPVWTAFLPRNKKPSSWMMRKGRRRVWLKDMQLYVFCNIYCEENMRQNRLGAFELEFVSEKGADKFMELFEPPPETPSRSPSPEPPRVLTPEPLLLPAEPEEKSSAAGTSHVDSEGQESPEPKREKDVLYFKNDEADKADKDKADETEKAEKADKSDKPTKDKESKEADKAD